MHTKTRRTHKICMCRLNGSPLFCVAFIKYTQILCLTLDWTEPNWACTLYLRRNRGFSFTQERHAMVIVHRHISFFRFAFRIAKTVSLLLTTNENGILPRKSAVCNGADTKQLQWNFDDEHIFFDFAIRMSVGRGPSGGRMASIRCALILPMTRNAKNV